MSLRFYKQASLTGQPLEWMTPDDFRVQLSATSLPSRLFAFLTDLTLLVLGTVILYFLLISALLTAVPALGSIAIVVFGLVHFLFWNGYGIWFEWYNEGMTPGKKWANVQVIQNRGGTLSFQSVLVRNLLKEVEIWIPLRVLFILWSGYDIPYLYLGCFALLLYPLLDPYNRRVGDLAAGTAVVDRPAPAELPEEVLETEEASRDDRSNYFFSTEMLEVYGKVQLYALQEVLEEQLYSENTYPRRERGLLQDIKQKVVEKIDYPRDVPDDESEVFLKAFYAAMRDYMEGQLISGRSTREELKEDIEGKRGKARDRVKRRLLQDIDQQE